MIPRRTKFVRCSYKPSLRYRVGPSLCAALADRLYYTTKSRHVNTCFFFFSVLQIKSQDLPHSAYVRYGTRRLFDKICPVSQTLASTSDVFLTSFAVFGLYPILHSTSFPSFLQNKWAYRRQRRKNSAALHGRTGANFPRLLFSILGHVSSVDTDKNLFFQFPSIKKRNQSAGNRR